MSSSKAHWSRSIGSRDEQQDSVSTLPLCVNGSAIGELLILADGMGGHTGGAIASECVVASVERSFANLRSLNIKDQLQMAVREANSRLAEKVDANPELKGMGSTLVIAAIVARTRSLHWISIGDSHLYISSPTSLEKLNADHSFAPLLDAKIASGELTPEEAANHDQRNVLRSALVGRPIPEIDEGEITIEHSTTVLLASDGLDSLESAVISKTLNSGFSVQNIAAKLLKQVEDAGVAGQDNTSVAILRLKDLKSGANASNPAHKRLFLVAALCVSLMISAGFAGWLWGTLSSSNGEPLRQEPVLTSRDAHTAEVHSGLQEQEENPASEQPSERIIDQLFFPSTDSDTPAKSHPTKRPTQPSSSKPAERAASPKNNTESSEKVASEKEVPNETPIPKSESVDTPKIKQEATVTENSGNSEIQSTPSQKSQTDSPSPSETDKDSSETLPDEGRKQSR